MSASDIKPENRAPWLQYVSDKREQEGERGIAKCERGHEDCSPVWNGTACGDYTEDKEVRGYCWGCMQPKAAHTATAIAGPMGSKRMAPSVSTPCPVHLVVSREELVEFIRCIAEGEPLFSSKLVQGQRAIELAAWDLYRRLQEGGEL